MIRGVWCQSYTFGVARVGKAAITDGAFRIVVLSAIYIRNCVTIATVIDPQKKGPKFQSMGSPK